MIGEFLIGVIFTTSMVAGLFFLKFWRQTRDLLFLAFALAFLIEGCNRLRFLALAEPSEGDPGIYVVRLLAFSLIIAAIVWKNRTRGRDRTRRPME